VRLSKLLLMTSSFLLIHPVQGQQLSTGNSPASATKDSQAVSIVTQALNTSGGNIAIGSISDFTASGNVTYYSGPNPGAQGTVTIKGRGLAQFRIDSKVSAGTRSESTNVVSTVQYEDGVPHTLSTQPPADPARFLLPTLQLKAALTNPSLNLLYRGEVNVDGRMVYDVQVQRTQAANLDPNSLIGKYLTFDYFIDASTSAVVMMQDTIPKGWSRQIRYSDFKAEAGILVPYSISETIQGQMIRVIQLNQIGFNSGLQDTDFQL
jgi:hypothetical protein